MRVLELSATVRFHGDWRVGSGAGITAGVDRAVLAERGVPIVPAKSLTGVWRDAAETLARGLDERTSPGAWQARVDELFGAQAPHAMAPVMPRPARLAVRTARLPGPLVDRLSQPRCLPLREALYAVRPGVRIDPGSGAALDDHLRLDQTARQGLRLSSSIELDVSELAPGEIDRLVALLAGSAAFIDALGAGRRRGLGGAIVALERPGDLLPHEDSVLEILGRTAPEEIERDVARGASGAVPQPSGATCPIVMKLDVSARSPLLLSPATTGNSQAGGDRIPGSHLLPIVCAAIDEVAGAGVAAAAVAHGELAVAGATPVVGGEPGRPVPLCLARFKDGRGFADPDGVRNAFAESNESAGAPIRQLKGLRSGYIGDFDGKTLPPFASPGRVTRVHAVIDDEAQRPTPGAGLYSYTALPAGERLAATVHIDGALAGVLGGRVPRLATALSGPRRIGRSKKDDYGAVSVVASEAPPESRERLEEIPTGGTLSVWLLDHLLLLGSTGAPEPTGDRLVRELERRLRAAAPDPGAPLELRFAAGPNARPRTLLRAGRIESWHAGWGLPRQTLCTLEPGSCAVLEVDNGTIAAQALAAVEHSGLGERAGEGLGRVRFSDPLLEAPLEGLDPAPRQPPAERPGPLPANAAELGALLEDAAWHREIARAAQLAAHLDARALLPGAAPSGSQLGNLRDAVAGDMAAAGLAAWLGIAEAKDEEKEKVKKRQLARGWCKGQLEHLEALSLSGADKLWRALERGLARPQGFFFHPQDEPALARPPSQLRQAHHDFALRATVDALARVLGERPSRDGGEENGG